MHVPTVFLSCELIVLPKPPRNKRKQFIKLRACGMKTFVTPTQKNVFRKIETKRRTIQNFLLMNPAQTSRRPSHVFTSHISILRVYVTTILKIIIRSRYPIMTFWKNSKGQYTLYILQFLRLEIFFVILEYAFDFAIVLDLDD